MSDNKKLFPASLDELKVDDRFSVFMVLSSGPLSEGRYIYARHKDGRVFVFDYDGTHYFDRVMIYDEDGAMLTDLTPKE